LKLRLSKLGESPPISVKFMAFKHIYSLALVIILAGGGAVPKAMGQALIPHTLQIEPETLERQGELLAQEAFQFMQFQQYDLALSQAKLATQLIPQDHRVWLLLGQLYLLQSEDSEAAIASYERANTLDPDNAQTWFALGRVYLDQEDYPQVIKHLQAGLKLAPYDKRAVFDLGVAYHRLDRLDLAVAQYKRTVVLESDFWPGINNIGLVEYERGDVAAALEQWEKAVAIDPEAAEPRLAIAVVRYDQGEVEEGLLLGEQAITLDPQYADLEFLRENLWGDKLIEATQAFLANPRMQTVIPQAEEGEVNPQDLDLD